MRDDAELLVDLESELLGWDDEEVGASLLSCSSWWLSSDARSPSRRAEAIHSGSP